MGEGRLDVKDQLDVEQLLAMLRARIREDELGWAGRVPAKGSVRTFDEAVYRNLHQARLSSGNLSVDYVVGWKTPIIGPLGAIVRRRIHQEIRIYIDALVRQQVAFNSLILRTVSHIVDSLGGLGLTEQAERARAQEQAIAALQEEVVRLRERVQALEQQVQTPGAPPSR